MATHARYIPPEEHNAYSLRSVISFNRLDYLWCPTKPLKNPYTKEAISLPLRHDNYFVGPNLLDKIIRTGTTESGLFWQLRDDDDFFHDPKKKQSSPKARYQIVHPLKNHLVTGGKYVDDAEDCVLIRKQSTVSMNRLIHILAIGLYGDAYKASMIIADKAAKEWANDIERAYELFLYLKAAKKPVHDADLPEHLKTSAAISKEIENQVLLEICNWLGVDAELEIPKRPRGRPKGAKNKTHGYEFHDDQGIYIAITVNDQDEVDGHIIKPINEWPEGTPLKNLSLQQLVEILALLKQREKIFDAELLEAYLDLLDDNWRDTIINNSESLAGQSDLNPYNILNISLNANNDDIKKAYRIAMRILHPDKEQAISRVFAQLVNEAYHQIRKEKGF